jgi:hypothetical protein
MKKKSIIIEILAIMLGPIGAYIGYYDRITCKPSQAGFWIIIALGIAIGVVITLIVKQLKDRKKTLTISATT